MDLAYFLLEAQETVPLETPQMIEDCQGLWRMGQLSKSREPHRADKACNCHQDGSLANEEALGVHRVRKWREMGVSLCKEI